MASAVAATAEPEFGIATGSWVAEREDWPSCLTRARAEGWSVLELTALDHTRLERLAALLEETPRALDGFDRVSVHAPVRFTTVSRVSGTLLTLPYDVILHPDVYAREEWVADLGPRAVFENMDAAKGFGRGVDDLRAVFTSFPEAGFCLDVAHVWTNDRSLRLGHELLDAFGMRLRQLHVSGIDRECIHRDTTRDDLALYAPLLERCRHVPWLLEGVLAENAL